MIETRTHNKANEILNTITHDANGNMTAMPRSNGSGNLNAVYDAWNRMVEVVGIAQYRYDGPNHRILKVIDGVETISFFNHGWQEIESKTGNEVMSYVWGLRYIDDLIYRQRGSEKLYSLADPNWNVVAICDNTGDVQERYTYDAFGKMNVFDTDFVLKTDSDLAWNRVFTGQVIDTETGIMLYRNRYYNTVLGRFISRDPVEYSNDIFSLFRYVFNNSMYLRDPLGLGCKCGETFTAIMAVGPINAYTARSLAGEATAVTGKVTGILGGGGHNDSVDAFRHCYWSCIMTLEIGEGNAKDIGDIHEECALTGSSPQPQSEASMDLHNNGIGRDLAKSCKTKADCESACLKEAKTGGRLQTSPGGTIPPGGPYPYPSPSYPSPTPTTFPVPIFIPGGPIFPPGTPETA
jgi:RHS repeat-associated protein